MVYIKSTSGAGASLLDLWSWTSIIVQYIYYNNGCGDVIDGEKRYC